MNALNGAAYYPRSAAHSTSPAVPAVPMTRTVRVHPQPAAVQVRHAVRLLQLRQLLPAVPPQLLAAGPGALRGALAAVAPLVGAGEGGVGGGPPLTQGLRERWCEAGSFGDPYGGPLTHTVAWEPLAAVVACGALRALPPPLVFRSETPS